DHAQERVVFGLTRATLWRSIMLHGVDEDTLQPLVFARNMGNTSLPPAHLVADALARIVPGPRHVVVDNPVLLRHRDALVALGTSDPDVVVNAELIRLCSVFLDHGQAMSRMPHREMGFLSAVDQLFETGSSEPRACRAVSADMRRIVKNGLTADQVIRESLAALGVYGDAIESYLLSTALALPGWAGMFSRLERHPEEHEGDRTVALTDFLAVRLVYDRRAAEYAARDLAIPLDWRALRGRVPTSHVRDPEQDAWMLASIVHSADLGIPETENCVVKMSDAELSEFFAEVDALPRLVRRKVWQEAYESRYRRQILDGMALLRPEIPAESTARPQGQFVFCIDEREESVRRAIEEQGSQYTTFGVAGFFGVAIDYRGLDDHETAAYCPIVVTPAHEVLEAPLSGERTWYVQRADLRERWNSASRGMHKTSRTLTGGAGLSLLIGPIAGVLAAARIVAPRGSLALRDRIYKKFVRRPSTRVMALRDRFPDVAPVDHQGSSKPLGFSLDEATDRVFGLLNNIGLVSGLAPIVVIIGHGSTSLNNPHESAHDCGACGGRRGGANARVFAEMANNPEVRAAMAIRGLHIPHDVWFVGALHDTADDSVKYSDLELLPETQSAAFGVAAAVLDTARKLSAAERCRRFDDTVPGIDPESALLHVEGRASHLAQPRPEYGHCTNAIAVVGRRRLTRGLHLDRRPFLISYDADIDQDEKIIERILAAVGPVGAGINLEYYFSSVDNERFGCGTKLPHNVTGLIGVMAGHQGDLRTGLPLQMVEIHEPMRLLLIVEASPAALLVVAGRQAEVAELVVNEWVQLVSVHPDTGEMQFFRDGAFHPYLAGTEPLRRVQYSPEWHTQGREHLPPALVEAALYV
ncbi:MAG: putative inorganic carbon transporter subunit DabA, partial [Gemmatimonadaceae bacterium]